MKEYIKHKITIAIYKNRMRKIIFLMLLFPLMYSCSNNEETEQLKKENEKLKKEFSFKDSTIKKIIRSFNQIIDNLHAITETEKAIAFTVRKNKKLMPDDKNKITEDVKMINSLIQQNKNIADTMRKNFSSAQFSLSEFDNMFENLNCQIEEKNNEINSLKQHLGEADITFNTFDFLFDKMTTLNVDMETKNNQQQAMIEKQQQQLNTAYYIFGTHKELKDAGVLAKAGITRIENPLKNFNTSKFIKIDMHKTTSINIWSNTFRVITNHPPDAYKTDRNSLVITNPDEFWKVT